jgi:hypothetical protein
MRAKDGKEKTKGLRRGGNDGTKRGKESKGQRNTRAKDEKEKTKRVKERREGWNKISGTWQENVPLFP